MAGSVLAIACRTLSHTSSRIQTGSALAISLYTAKMSFLPVLFSTSATTPSMAAFISNTEAASNLVLSILSIPAPSILFTWLTCLSWSCFPAMVMLALSRYLYAVGNPSFRGGRGSFLFFQARLYKTPEQRRWPQQAAVEFGMRLRRNEIPVRCLW